MGPAFYSGLRIGELQALDWQHVDLEANLIRVERSWNRVAGFIAVKSGAGRRSVSIPKVLRPYLVAQRLATGASGLAFPTIHGNVFEPSNVRKVARRRWDKAGLSSGPASADQGRRDLRRSSRPQRLRVWISSVQGTVIRR